MQLNDLDYTLQQLDLRWVHDNRKADYWCRLNTLPDGVYEANDWSVTVQYMKFVAIQPLLRLSEFKAADKCGDVYEQWEGREAWCSLVDKEHQQWRARKDRNSHCSKSSDKQAKKNKRSRKRGSLSLLRRRARRAMSRRFVSVDSGGDPKQNQRAGLVASKVTTQVVRPRKLGTFHAVIGDARVRKKFIKALRRALVDLGFILVGPLPVMLLEQVWLHFGEKMVAPHGPTCWCVECRSSTPVHEGFLQSLCRVLWDYLVKMPVSVILNTILPAPLKTARFVANRLWKWLKVFSDDVPRQLRWRWRRLITWVQAMWNGKVERSDFHFEKHSFPSVY